MCFVDLPLLVINSLVVARHFKNREAGGAGMKNIIPLYFEKTSGRRSILCLEFFAQKKDTRLDYTFPTSQVRECRV